MKSRSRISVSRGLKREGILHLKSRALGRMIQQEKDSELRALGTGKDARISSVASEEGS